MNFGSDNTAGASPEILAALSAANDGAAMPYGNDAMTQSVEKRIADIFETNANVFLVPTGTAANALSLAVMCPPFGAVLCHAGAHIQTDECGAPEFYTGGAKLIGLSEDSPTLELDDVTAELAKPDRGVHHVRPSALSISQLAETGAVYTPDAIQALADVAHAKDMTLHMDGARFANALTALDTTAADLTWKSGVDILCFGATKNGALMAEAVVVFNESLVETLAYRRKRGGHLASKMRFLAAQFDAYLRDDLWLNNARHANAVSHRLSSGLAAIDGISLAWDAPANEIFVDMPTTVADGLEADGFIFYRWQPLETRVRVRLVSAFNSAHADAEAFVASAARHAANAASMPT